MAGPQDVLVGAEDKDTRGSQPQQAKGLKGGAQKLEFVRKPLMLSGSRVILLELHFPPSLLWPMAGGWAGGETIKKLNGIILMDTHR